MDAAVQWWMLPSTPNEITIVAPSSTHQKNSFPLGDCIFFYELWSRGYVIIREFLSFLYISCTLGMYLCIPLIKFSWCVLATFSSFLITAFSHFQQKPFNTSMLECLAVNTESKFLVNELKGPLKGAMQ